jgi:exodeoxyribonuclease V beta subunit
MSTILTPLHFPLFGSSLIEASAGTGKTYTIALLYTRLILQHGKDSSFYRPLLPKDILVVTFTDAATQELKERIRARLAEAARCFATPRPEDDRLLTELRADYPADDWPRCAHLLTVAAQAMDQAAVSTIHSWCYRMLREHAFDSGTLFRQTLITNMQDIQQDLIQDYWRQHFYSLSPACAALVKKAFASPTELLAAVKPLLNKDNTVVTYRNQPLTLTNNLTDALAEFANRYSEAEQAQTKARVLWLTHWEELEALLDQLRPKLDKRSYTGAKTDQGFADLKMQLRKWAHGDEFAGQLSLFGHQGMKLNGGTARPDHPALRAVDSWQQAIAAANNKDIPDPRAVIMRHARNWLEQALERRIHEQAELGFDDLLLQLDRALRGAQGSSLAAQIREEYPVALIDEFQDTDPLQYRIFDRIYAIAENRAQQAIVLIGDPKQSIYSFRNADIHTYLAARAATSGRHYYLDTNFRSSNALVDSVNACFSRAEQFDQGAFLFQNADSNPLPFLPVKAKGREETLYAAQSPAAALTVWHLDPDDSESGVINKSRYQQDMAVVCAAQIAHILNPDQPWRFVAHQQHPVQPKDIAILVRDRQEAQQIRRALHTHQLASVYLSDRESVFSSVQAHDVLRWLRACAEPADERSLRAALGTVSLGLELTELQHMFRDEQHWEAQAEHFRLLHQRWLRDGVLPMLRDLIQFYQLPQRLKSRLDGERTLTNLLHLAEYLQQASVEHEGEQALIRHLSEMIRDPGNEEILRLESDEDLIRIVTIHKSKGLQYPLVFVPFAANWRSVKAEHGFSLPDSNSPLQRRLEIAASKGDDNLLIADRQRLAEDMRLLYVAMTRAIHACWLSVGLLNQQGTNASLVHLGSMGYLLAGGAPLNREQLRTQLHELTDSCAGIRLEHITAVPATPLQPVSLAAGIRPTADGKPATQARHQKLEPWWISSYTAIKGGDPHPEPEQAADDQTVEESDSQLAAESVLRSGTGRREFNRNDSGLHGFARGPKPGTFLHHLLEWACEFGFAKAAGDHAARLEHIRGRCALRGWQDEEDRLDSWLQQFLDNRFLLPNGVTFKLGELPVVRPEMEFMFAANHINTAQIDQLCQRFLLPGQARPALRATELNGMIKGFIDLTFCHDDCYFVADWKSNHLGRNDAAYDSATISGEVLQHRYDVQYAIYLLALHRLLRSRLTDYDYDKHIGGAIYFFLRGWQAPTQGLLFDKPAREFIDSLDSLFTGQPVVAEQHAVPGTGDDTR